MLRRVIYMLALALAAGTIGYVLAGRAAEPAAIVVSPPTPAAAPDAGIDWTNLSDQDLQVARIFMVAQATGVEAALDSLQTLAKSNADVAREGHQLAHALGRFTVGRNNNDPAVLAHCRPLFQAGCYHGVLEGYLSSVQEVNGPKLAGMCADLSGRGTAIISARECAHGLGHGLIERVGYDFGPALRACDAFRSAALREECHDGVFMQNLVNGQGLPTSTGADGAEGEGHQHGASGEGTTPTSGFRADDLTFPCNSVGEPYQPSCWSYQPVAIRRFLGDPGPPTMFTCDQAPEASRKRCYAGYGKQTLARYDNDTNRMVEVCSLATPPHDDECLSGVVEVLIDREWGPDDAMSFCGRIATFGRDATACYEMIGARISLLHADREEVSSVCASAPEPAFVAACRKGADG